jgi:hypothetical protein
LSLPSSIEPKDWGLMDDLEDILLVWPERELLQLDVSEDSTFSKHDTQIEDPKLKQFSPTTANSV